MTLNPEFQPNEQLSNDTHEDIPTGLSEKTELEEQESIYTTKLIMSELTHNLRTGKKIIFPETQERTETIDGWNDEVKEKLYTFILLRAKDMVNKELNDNCEVESVKDTVSKFKQSGGERGRAHDATAQAIMEQWPSLFKNDLIKARRYIEDVLGDATSEDMIFQLNNY